MESSRILLLGLPLMACGGSEAKPPAVHRAPALERGAPFRPTLALSPKTAHLAPGASQSFSAQINYEPDGPRFPRQPVSWTVVEAGGGTITRTGLYTAPAKPGTYHVKAEREDHAGVRDTATVTVEAALAPVKPG